MAHQDSFSQYTKKSDPFSQFEKKKEEEKEGSLLDTAIKPFKVAKDLGLKAWEWGNKPLPGAGVIGDFFRIASVFNPSSVVRSHADTVADIAESSFTPINLGMAAITGGEAVAAKMGITTAAKLLHGSGKALSLPFIAEGYTDIKEAENWPERLLGVAELAGGVAGVQAKPFSVRRPNIPVPKPTEAVMPDVPIVKKPWKKTPDEVLRESLELKLQPDKPVVLYDQFGKPLKLESEPTISREPKWKVEGDKFVLEEPQAAKVEGGVKIGADIESLSKVLGSSLYQGNIARVVTKELTQNAFDAVRNLGSGGKIIVNINDTLGDKAGKFIEVIDNGPGLTRAELETVFTDLGASGKRADVEAIGGFGLAKAAPLLGGEKVFVETVSQSGGNKIKYSFSGTPDELIKGVKIESVLVPSNTPTGTKVRTMIPKETSIFEAKTQIENTIDNSPGLEAAVEFNTLLDESIGYHQPKIKNPGGLNINDYEITPIQTDNADINVLIPKTTEYGEFPVKLEYLNQGMWQGSNIDWKRYPGIPKKILVDIKSKVPEGHANYPFTANRESLRGPVLDEVTKAIQDTIIKPAVGRRFAQLRAVYNGMPEVKLPVEGKVKFYVYDVGKKFTPDELTAVISNPEVIKLSSLLSKITNEAISFLDFTGKERIHKIGLIFDETVHGIYIPSPGEEKAAILLNPFASISFSSPDQATARIMHTILHELAHASGGGHDENFTGRLGNFYSQYGAKKSIDTQGEILNAITHPGDRTRYNDELSGVLQKYTEARGRKTIGTDPLRGTGIGSPNKGPEGTGKVFGDSGPSRTAIAKVVAAIRDARPLRAEQAEMISAEKSARVREMVRVRKGGEAGFYKRLGKLKGEYEKLDFESIRHKLDQEDVDALFDVIDTRTELRPFEKINASVALGKILGEMGGQVPTKYELALLDRVYGEGFSNMITDAGFILNPFTEPIRITSEITNFFRAVMISNDLSAPLRQGSGLITRPEYWGSLGDMGRAWGSEKAYRATMDAIELSPEYGFSREVGLKLTDIGNYTVREEQFMSKLAEKVPGVRRSERAYMAFLNKVRFDTFNSLIRDARAAGLDPDNNLVLAKEIADYVNNASGRGSLGSWEKGAVILNSLAFSPRLIASRVRMLNPATYVNASPFVRKQYLRSLIGIAGLGGTTLGLGSMGGGTIEENPNSADFGKLRIGNVRLDPWGGFQQYLVAAHRLISGEMKSTTTDREFELGGRYGTPTKFDVAIRFGETKLNPTMSFITTMLRGKDFQGMPVSAQKEIASRFVPIIAQDIYELAMEDPKLLPLIVPAALGMGVQAYQPRTSGYSIMFGDIAQQPNPNIRY